MVLRFCPAREICQKGKTFFKTLQGQNCANTRLSYTFFTIHNSEKVYKYLHLVRPIQRTPTHLKPALPDPGMRVCICIDFHPKKQQNSHTHSCAAFFLPLIAFKNVTVLWQNKEQFYGGYKARLSRICHIIAIRLGIAAAVPCVFFAHSLAGSRKCMLIL